MEAQNIVLNGGFEDILHCPVNSGELYYAPPWGSGDGSVDLFNACNDGEWGIPINRGGVQWPRTGDGYASFATYSTFGLDARELLWQPVRYSLVANEPYYFEMYVSLRDSLKYAVHNMGIVFEDTILNSLPDLDCLFQCEPVVENTSTNPLVSKTEWIKVSGTFVANGGEKYIFIGNLRNDAQSEIEFVGGSVGNGQYTWEESGYYVDDVWLSHIDSMHYVGVEELPIGSTEGARLEVYPNPSVSGSVTVSCNLSGGDVAELLVFDGVGRLVISETLPFDKLRTGRSAQRNKTIALNGLTEGIYHCVLVVNGKLSLSEKLVISKE